MVIDIHAGEKTYKKPKRTEKNSFLNVFDCEKLIEQFIKKITHTLSHMEKNLGAGNIVVA